MSGGVVRVSYDSCRQRLKRRVRLINWKQTVYTDAELEERKRVLRVAPAC